MFESSVEMAAALTTVVDAPTAALNSTQLLDQLSVIGELESVLAAQKAQTMVAFHAALSGPSADLGHQTPRPGDRIAGPTERRWSGDVLRSVTDEIGLVLGTHRRTAACWLNRAALLVDRFPTTLALLRAGAIPVLAAQHLAKALAVIVDDELRAAVEKLVLAWGQRYGWRRIKQVAIREARKVTAEYDSLLHAQRQDERTTYTVKHDGGIADLVVSTSAIDTTAIMTSLTARAKQLQRDGDPRNLDQLRTDLAVHRLLGKDQAAGSSTANDRGGVTTTTTANPEPSADIQSTSNLCPATHPESPTEPTEPTAPRARRARRARAHRARVRRAGGRCRAHHRRGARRRRRREWRRREWRRRGGWGWWVVGGASGVGGESGGGGAGGDSLHLCRGGSVGDRDGLYGR